MAQPVGTPSPVMEFIARQILFIPFGVDAWAPQDIAILRCAPRAVVFKASFPCVCIDRAGTPTLRLNEGGYDLTALPREEIAADPLASVQRYLRALCRPYDRTAQRLIDAYIRRILALLEERRSELERRLAPFGGLYSWRDFAFSAPRPLPRAHLPVGAESTSVQVDFAFWIGGRLVALDASAGRMTPRRAREHAAALAAAGAETIAYDERDLADGGVAMFDRLLASAGAPFWEGQTVPAGPFPSPVLDGLAG